MAESPQPSFTCPHCGKTSYHPEDIKHSYCGNCHLFMKDVQHLADQLQISLDHAVRIYRNEAPFPTS